MRKPLVAGNWKMNKTIADTRDLVFTMSVKLREINGVEKVICPPYTSLMAASALLEGSGTHQRIDMGRRRKSQPLQIITAFQKRDEAPLAALLGQFHQLGRRPGIVMLDKLDVPEGITVVHVKARRDQDQVRAMVSRK